MNYPTRAEEILLMAVWKLKDNAYGVTIRKQIRKVTGRQISFGALYVSLNKLANKGLLNKTHGEPVAERGGRHKIFYTLTSKGEKALGGARRLHSLLWEGIPEKKFKV